MAVGDERAVALVITRRQKSQGAEPEGDHTERRGHLVREPYLTEDSSDLSAFRAAPPVVVEGTIQDAAVFFVDGGDGDTVHDT